MKEPFLVFKNTEFMGGFNDVNEVVGDGKAIYNIFIKILACSDIHADIDLSGVGRDDF